MKKLVLTLMALLVTTVAQADMRVKPVNMDVGSFRQQVEPTVIYYDDINNNKIVDEGEFIKEGLCGRYTGEQFETKEEYIALITSDLTSHLEKLVVDKNESFIMTEKVRIDEPLVIVAAQQLTEEFTGKTITRTFDGVEIVAKLNYVQPFNFNRKFGLYFDIDFSISGVEQPRSNVKKNKSIFSFEVKSTDTKASKMLEVRDRVISRMKKMVKSYNLKNDLQEDFMKLDISVNSKQLIYQGKIFNVSTDSNLNTVTDAIN